MKVFPSILFVLVALLLTLPAFSAEPLVVQHSEKGLTIRCNGVPLEKVLEELHAIFGTEIIVEEAAGQKNVTTDIEVETLREAIEELLDGAEVNYAMSFDPIDHHKLAKLYVGAGDPHAPRRRMSTEPEEPDAVEPEGPGDTVPGAPGSLPAPPLNDDSVTPPVDDDPYDTPDVDEGAPIVMPPMGDPNHTPALPIQGNPASPTNQPKPKKKKN